MKVFIVKIVAIRLEFPSGRPVDAFATADDILEINGVVVVLKSTLVPGKGLILMHIEKLLFTVELGDTQGRFWSKLAEGIKGSLPNGIGEKSAVRFRMSDVAKNHV